jgi:PAS domain S-box-containing protein
MVPLPRWITRLPELEHEGELRQARLINTTVWIVALGTTLATLNSMLTSPRGVAMYSVFGGLIVALFGARALMLRKRLDAAGYLVTGSIWAVLVYVLVLDGLASPALGGLVLVAIIGAAVVGARAAAGVGVGSAVVILLIHALTSIGVLEPSQAGVGPRAAALTAAMQMLTGALLIALLTRERNQAFSRAYDLTRNAPDGILAIDARGLVQSVNPAFEQITGLARGSVLHHSPDEWPVLDDVARAKIRAAMRELAGDGESVSVELELEPTRGQHARRSADTRVVVECLARKLPASASNHRYQVSVRDISKRRLLERQLLQAQKLESIGRLAGGIAHDFNNMLTAIGGHAALLEADATPAQAEDIRDLLACVDRASALTRQLLVFSRPDREVLRPTDVVAVARELAPMLRRLIGEDIQLELRIADQPQVVLGDPTLFEQIIVNLVVNARDAMPRGGAIELCVEPDGEGVRLEVSDTGEGMSAESLERAFEPFFSTKAPGKGTGLGLAVVHGAVTRAGGRIDLDSSLGAGTRVRMWFPRSAAPPSDAGEQTRKLAQRGTGLILLVEDDHELRRVTERLLQQAGYRVVATDGAEQALARVAELAGEIDLVLSDVIMPGQSGFDLAHAIEVERPNTPILLMSGHTPEDLAARHPSGEHPSGEQRWPILRKPFTPAQLGACVRELLTAKPDRVAGS